MSNTLPQPKWTPISDLLPAPWNPRLISDDRFINLCRSIKSDPSYLHVKPILATLDGTIWAGNMRYRAAVHLGMEQVPAVKVAISEQLARQRAIQDNRTWGEWDTDMLAELVYGLHESGDDTSLLGFSDREISELLGSVSAEGQEREPGTPPLRCATCGQTLQEDGEFS